MIRINLLPFRAARKRENIKRQLTFFGLSLLLTFVVIAYLFLQVGSTLGGLKKDKKTVEAELATYEKTIKEINRLEKQIKDLKQKLKVIRDLEAGKTGPVRLLDEVALAVPKDRLWLDSFNEKGGTLTLRGNARDNDTVAEFMVNLERSSLIQSVDLKRTSLKTLQGQSLSNFTLTCKTYKFQTKPTAQKGKKKGKRRK
jgi:type IV pilus assembly protein PilN